MKKPAFARRPAFFLLTLPWRERVEHIERSSPDDLRG
jgi:hypothetical protein